MGVDYSANVVYGVIPEGPFYERFMVLLGEELESMEPPIDDPDLTEEENEARYADWEKNYEDLSRIECLYEASFAIFEKNPDLLEELRGQYQAPSDARMHWSGNSDDRAGRCYTESEIWLFGIGMTELHKPKHYTDVWLQQAEYHNWVEAW
jgi:hypothetical protein